MVVISLQSRQTSACNLYRAQFHSSAQKSVGLLFTFQFHGSNNLKDNLKLWRVVAEWSTVYFPQYSQALVFQEAECSFDTRS